RSWLLSAVLGFCVLQRGSRLGKLPVCSHGPPTASESSSVRRDVPVSGLILHTAKPFQSRPSSGPRSLEPVVDDSIRPLRLATLTSTHTTSSEGATSPPPAACRHLSCYAASYSETLDSSSPSRLPTLPSCSLPLPPRGRGH